ELLDWAVGADALIIEEDYDAEYRYDRAPVPALQTAAPGHVAYAGTTSKTLAPGMRLGWLVPPARLHADLGAGQHGARPGRPALPDALLGELREHLPEARVQGVPPGLHLLITFPARAGKLDDRDLDDRD